MKHPLHILIVLVFYLLGASLTAQESDVIKEYLERFENSKKYLLEVANAMPEEKYDYRPARESLSFAENLMHIGYAMDWHTQSLLGGRESRNWNTDTRYKVADKSKEEIINVVKETFQETIDFIKEFDITQFDEELDYFGFNRTKRQIFLLLTDHIAHHRGQITVYLRLNGQVPPRYVLFQ
ncbi:DinB family protein [Flagellimonas meridianipacifica]|uniref:Putative damage-inducible protein DinB n=1 Tax=Flagellimonas meridianipacifica TaxID=1080225 RepID=A0A2T0MBJ6_9FLAO|nr:DinB family protein [Allomuricauda pacifica]PRX54874.1 putative damage-inducible protein DinB [Allomuricauda pacifica]